MKLYVWRPDELQFFPCELIHFFASVRGSHRWFRLNWEDGDTTHTELLVRSILACILSIVKKSRVQVVAV